MILKLWYQSMETYEVEGLRRGLPQDVVLPHQPPLMILKLWNSSREIKKPVKKKRNIRAREISLVHVHVQTGSVQICARCLVAILDILCPVSKIQVVEIRTSLNGTLRTINKI